MAGFVQAVAVDLDGTIAHGAELDRDVLAVLDDCHAAGTATLLVTGRIEAEVCGDFPNLLEHFDAVVLENCTFRGHAESDLHRRYGTDDSPPSDSPSNETMTSSMRRT